MSGKSKGPLVMAALFGVALLAAWGWFHVAITPPEKSFVLHARETVPGYKFKALPVGEQAVEILATTNLFNGVFEGSGDNRFIVFAADWQPRGKKGMGVIAHTPEICWVGAGFSLMHLGEPSFLEVEIAGEKVPFECRVFRAPDQRSVEMVAWCSVLSGQWLEEGFQYQPDRDQTGSSKERQADNSRVRGANAFMRAVKLRQPGDGTKQFVRFSTGVGSDWKASYARLQQFAKEWLEVRVTKS